MNISELSIRRPVLATVLTIIILLFGLIGYNTLGVREYPSVDNPIISVTCSYSGANADVIENQITEPLEQNINGIPGIRSLSSVSQQGQCIIRKTKCFDFWERNVLFPKTKRSFFRTPKHPLPCPFPLNFSLLIITKKFGNLAKNRYICIV